MFVVTQEHYFDRTVTVKMPDPAKKDGVVTQSFSMTFLAIGRSDALRFEAEQEARTPLEREAHKHDFTLHVARGWSDIVDEDKKPIPFSPELLRRLLDRAWFETGVYEAYRAGMAAEPRLGN